MAWTSKPRQELVNDKRKNAARMRKGSVRFKRRPPKFVALSAVLMLPKTTMLSLCFVHGAEGAGGLY